MYTGITVFLFTILLLGFIFIYKKQMLSKVFTSNMSESASQFTDHLEQTADLIIRRLEEEAAQLELLLEEAEIKIGMLSQQVEHANKIIEQLIALEKKPKHLEFEQSEAKLITDNAISNVVQPKYFAAVQGEDSQTNIDLSLPDNNNIDQESINTQKYRHIIAMAEQGCSVTEIAKATGMGKGEIMLLLQLNK